jgi:hypothetical protein
MTSFSPETKQRIYETVFGQGVQGIPANATPQQIEQVNAEFRKRDPMLNGGGIGLGQVLRGMSGGGATPPAFGGQRPASTPITQQQNQQLYDQVFGKGAVQVGEGRGAAFLATATPEKRAQFEAAKRQLDPSYQLPTSAYNGGVSPVGVVEPLTDWQKSALTGLAGGFQDNVYAPQVQSAFSQAMQSVQGAPQLTDASFQQYYNRYMNPYTQDVVNRSSDAIKRQADIRRAELLPKFRNSFGSTAQGLEMSKLNDDSMRQIGDLSSSLFASGFEQATGNALNNYNSDFSNAMSRASAFGGLANQGMQASNFAYDNFRRPLQDRLGAGEYVQNQNQNMLDVVRGEIDARRNFPYDQLTRLQGRIEPFSGSTSTGYGITPSPLTQLGGLGLAASSGFDKDGNWSVSNIFGGKGALGR